MNGSDEADDVVDGEGETIADLVRAADVEIAKAQAQAGTTP
jgi:hypothetical protein